MTVKKTIALLLALAVIAGAVYIGMPETQAINAEALYAADTLYGLGLFSGTGSDENGNPNYDLEGGVTREAAVTMLVRILGGAEAAAAGGWSTPFGDLPAGHWAENTVGYAYATGLTTGVGDGTAFGLGQPVTIQQLITFVLRALSYSDAEGDFSYGDCWSFSDSIGLTDGRYNLSNAGDLALRADLVIICRSALDAPRPSGEESLYELLFPGNDLTVTETMEEPALPAPVVLMSSAPGDVLYHDGASPESSSAVVDASNTSDGYVMVKYIGGEAKIKLLMTGPGGVTYTYNLRSDGQYEVFPFSDGSGSYKLSVCKNIEGTRYSIVYSVDLSVSLRDEFAPFLRPNQYVNYSSGSTAVLKASELAAGKSDELDVVASVYNYVVTNISYDREKAASVQSGYLPDVDAVLSSKKGICFDYAALMTAMLRSQGIPSKLVVGYAGSAYHAWISVYTAESGWVDAAIYFDGVSWKRMDPTFASSSGSSDWIIEYIGDGSNYSEKFLY